MTQAYSDKIRASNPRQWEAVGAMVDASDLIHDAMEKIGITQAELARRLKVSRATVAGYVRGEQNLTVTKLAEILHALGFSLELQMKKATAAKRATGTKGRRPKRITLGLAIGLTQAASVPGQEMARAAAGKA